MFDAIVIGAGVVGGLVARELTRNNLSVCILEKEGDVALGATRANSAIVHAGFDAKEGTLKAKLNVRGSLLMESVCSDLGVKYKRNGSLVVGFDKEDERTLRGLIERGKANGVPGLRLLTMDEVRVLEPNIGESVSCALLAPTGAIVCPYELCVAAVGNAIDNGATFIRNFKVDKIEKKDGFFRVYSGKRSYDAKYAVNCAGVYSDEVAELVGDRSFRVRPRRGEYLLFDKDTGAHVSHTVFRCPSKMGKGVLVTPTVDGNLLVGPTAEDIDSKTDVRTTATGAADIRKKASEQVKGLDFRRVITSFAGLRATGSTGDFVINTPTEGFVNCAGIESPGLSAAPAIAEYVAEVLSDMGAQVSEKPGFVKTRHPMHYFRELDRKEKNKIIKERPEYAKIVCRCETVSEGEILEAIRTEPRPVDIDGVKRRTRATMGRCQGGFCTPYIVELLAREMGVDYLDITKCGEGSYMNLCRTKGKNNKNANNGAQKSENSQITVGGGNDK